MTDRNVVNPVIVERVDSDADVPESRILVPSRVAVINGFAEVADTVLLDLLEQLSKLSRGTVRTIDNSLRYRGSHSHN